MYFHRYLSDLINISIKMGKKRKLKDQEKLFEENEEKKQLKLSEERSLSKEVKEIDLPSKFVTTNHLKNQEKRLIIILVSLRFLEEFREFLIIFIMILWNF